MSDLIQKLLQGHQGELIGQLTEKANLATKMDEVNDEKKLTRVLPSEKAVTGWVEQAKGLPATITH
jgi:hypothetical protein